MGNFNFTLCNISIFFRYLNEISILYYMKRAKYCNYDKRWESNYDQRFISCTKKILWVFIITLSLSQCSSCIHENSLHFSVTNLTEDTLIITTKKIIPYFYVRVNRSENVPRQEAHNNSYVNISDTIFVLPPNAVFEASKLWTTREILSDHPEADGVTPAWKFIKRMELGGKLLSPEIWNSEQKWRISLEYEDVNREYSLTISN